MERQHGFTRVDEEFRPDTWVDCLDRLQREPFYQQCKQRVREILSPWARGLYLEVGAGAGTDARALGGEVIGVDKSLTMCRELRGRGFRLSIVGSAEDPPLRSGLVDGCWSDRTFQHLANPQGALAELLRVMKPSARIVVVDPDYGTQSM
jgi:SAM-dependent methyltransferase